MENKDEMSHMKHTKEPWKVCGANEGRCKCHLIWSKHSDKVVGSAYNSDEAQADMADGEPESNVQRIVDCVNGFAGIKDVEKFMKNIRREDCSQYRIGDCIENKCTEGWICPRCEAIVAFSQ